MVRVNDCHCATVRDLLHIHPSWTHDGKESLTCFICSVGEDKERLFCTLSWKHRFKDMQAPGHGTVRTNDLVDSRQYS